MGLKWVWFCLVSAAAFFVTYEWAKSLLGAGGAPAAPQAAPVTHMLAASLGEVVSPRTPPSFTAVTWAFTLVRTCELFLFGMLIPRLASLAALSSVLLPLLLSHHFLSQMSCALVRLPFKFHRPLFSGAAGNRGGSLAVGLQGPAGWVKGASSQYFPHQLGK